MGHGAASYRFILLGISIIIFARNWLCIKGTNAWRLCKVSMFASGPGHAAPSSLFMAALLVSLPLGIALHGRVPPKLGIWVYFISALKASALIAVSPLSSLLPLSVKIFYTIFAIICQWVLKNNGHIYLDWLCLKTFLKTILRNSMTTSTFCIWFTWDSRGYRLCIIHGLLVKCTKFRRKIFKAKLGMWCPEL